MTGTDNDTEWITLDELARLLGKSYANVAKLYRSGALVSHGLGFLQLGHRQRVWVRIDRQFLARLESDALQN